MSRRSLSIALQPRDFAILRDLFECRVMTLGHITALHFDSRAETAKKRIQKLKAAGLLSEGVRRRGEPSILFLSRAALPHLYDHGELEEYPPLSPTAFEKRARVSELTIRHELAVMDVKVAFTKAIAQVPNLKLLQFNTWPRLYHFSASTASAGFSARPGLIKPDGYLRIWEEGTGEHVFFLEVDRTTKTLAGSAARAVAYLDYYRSGGFAAWGGGTRDEYKKYPFRVLGVFLSEIRRHNFAIRLLQNNPPIRHQFQLASFADVIKDPLGHVWNCPADYESHIAAPRHMGAIGEVGNWSKRNSRVATEPPGRFPLIGYNKKAEQSVDRSA